jgi:hypothetical protein
MDKLKVGDKLYNAKGNRWTNDIHYTFSTVERLTKTQAVLSCGTKLINEPILAVYPDKKIAFMVHGYRYVHWYFETPEIREKAAKEKHKQTAVYWFNSQKFNDQDKIRIYELFKNQQP